MAHKDIINLSKEKQKLRKLRKDVWILYNGNKFEAPCYVCTKHVDAHSFEAGHIISLHNGGLTEIENLRPLCKVCNRSMSARNMDEFIINYGYNSRLLKENIPKYNMNTKRDDAFSRFTKIPITLHNQIWREYNGSRFFAPCYVCHQMINALNYTVCTVIAIKSSGKIEIRNLRPVCKECKSKVGCKGMVDYIMENSLNSRILHEGLPEYAPTYIKGNKRSVNVSNGNSKNIKNNKIGRQMGAFLKKVKTDIGIYTGEFKIDDDVPILEKWKSR